jgi:hypothetical protein
MAAKKAKKLYAVYKPNGDLAGEPQPTRLMAWGSAALHGSIAITDNVKDLQRNGYECAAVIVEQLVTRLPPPAARRKVKS